MTSLREWARAAFGTEAGDEFADRCAAAMARAIDAEVFHGTTPTEHRETSPSEGER